MALQLGHCTDEDMSRVFELVSISFGHEHPFIEAVYPAHDSPSGRADGAERLLAIKKADPHTKFLKVTDTSTGKVVGISKWNVYDKAVPEEVTKFEGDYWATEDAKELAEWHLNEYLKLRRKAIRDSGGNLVCKSTSAALNVHLAIRLWTVRIEVFVTANTHQQHSISCVSIRSTTTAAQARCSCNGERG